MYVELINRLQNIAEQFEHTGANFATISIKDDNIGCYAFAHANRIAILDHSGNIIAGDVNAETTFFSALKCIYDTDNEIGAVIIPRTRWCSIAAQLGRIIPPVSFLHAQYFKGEILSTGSIVLENNQPLPEGIVNALAPTLRKKQHSASGAVLLRNDSAIVWSKTLETALERASVLEELCYRFLHTAAVNEGADSYVAFEVSELLYKE